MSNSHKTKFRRGFQNGAGQKEGAGNPPLPVENSDGVDVTLIRWMLAKSPRERLLATQAAARAILRLRSARSSS